MEVMLGSRVVDVTRRFRRDESHPVHRELERRPLGHGAASALRDDPAQGHRSGLRPDAVVDRGDAVAIATDVDRITHAVIRRPDHVDVADGDVHGRDVLGLTDGRASVAIPELL
jgi:hypothetical protein